MMAQELVARLRERYSGAEWAFFEELRGGTAFSRESRCDALAMNLWPSRGMEMHGHEVKVDRRDWLKELKAPAKSEQIQQFCDRWWVVVPDRDLVQPGELPPTWGLLVADRGHKLLVVTEAPKLSTRAPDRAFVAALLRRSAKEDVVATAVKMAVEQARKRWDAEAARLSKHLATANVSQAQAELRALRATVQAFEEASGIKITAYAAGRQGAALKRVLVAQDLQAELLGLLRYAVRASEALAGAAKAQLEHLERPA